MNEPTLVAFPIIFIHHQISCNASCIVYEKSNEKSNEESSQCFASSYYTVYTLLSNTHVPSHHRKQDRYLSFLSAIFL